MLTFISGWRSAERDKVLLEQRDINRPSHFFIDNSSTLPSLVPDVPIVEVWRNGRIEFPPIAGITHIVRLNHDTDNALIVPSVSQSLKQNFEAGKDAQIIVMFDAVNALFRLFPTLRERQALLAADARLDADEGDHVIFMRGGSFSWKDHVLETQTATLTGSEIIDMGIVSEDMALNLS